ncbi:hypothetical protein F5Y19DRAFT_314976 [Xylariaceae sp. FL1651]|nr:hypothetical protein F5Y19DRAFT_314976 [Xylariaceae sp. FL1651]
MTGEVQNLPIRGSDGPSPGAKRRRVRKGTRSCWECRRRKIRCQYSSEDAVVCNGCESRGTNCVSQQFADEQAPAPDRRITQRLGRVEEMLEKLVDKIMPDSYSAGRSSRAGVSPASAAGDDDPVSAEDECPLSAAIKPPIFDLLGSFQENHEKTQTNCGASPLTPAASHDETSAWSGKYAHISRKLHDLLPCQQDIDAIVTASPGSAWTRMFYSRYHDLAEGVAELPPAIGDTLSPLTHPAVLAQQLMRLTICIQQLPPTVSLTLASREPVRSLMGKFVSAVSDLVAHHDDLIGYIEGVEALALTALYHANVGNLRKAWLILRRALSIGQLMGVDRFNDKPLSSADPKSAPFPGSKAKPLWFRLNFTDRYLSLLLGLPACTDDNSFLDSEADDEPTDRLEKQHTVVMGAIIKRNSSNKGDSAFGATQAIDCDLETAARSVGTAFWQLPTITAFTKPVERIRGLTQLMLQMNHHNLLILLHLPYMLRDPKERRWDYSKATCISSSRQLLRTFVFFREVKASAFSCRHTDYGALTAAMTLLLAYLDPKLQARDQATTSRREADRVLIQEARDRLQQMAVANNDKLSHEAAGMIDRLLPLTNPDLMMSNGGQEGTNEGVGDVPPICLEIPYLGTILINPSSARSYSSAQHDTHPHAHASPAPLVSSTVSPSTTANQQEHAGFPTSTLFSHNTQPATTDWNALHHQQQFTPPGGEQGADGSLSFMFPIDNASNPSNCCTFDGGFAPMMQFEWSQEQLAHPELAAEADQWTFQGFDTTYFESLFSSGVHGS